jgi:hypothetical protein
MSLADAQLCGQKADTDRVMPQVLRGPGNKWIWVSLAQVCAQKICHKSNPLNAGPSSSELFLQHAHCAALQHIPQPDLDIRKSSHAAAQESRRRFWPETDHDDPDRTEGPHRDNSAPNVRCDVPVLSMIVVRAIEFAARSDRYAVLKKHEWSGAGQDFDGKFARRFRVWNVHVSYGIHKAVLSAQEFDFNPRSQEAQRTAIPGGDAVRRYLSRSIRQMSVFPSLSHFCEHVISNLPGGEDLRRNI